MPTSDKGSRWSTWDKYEDDEQRIFTGPPATIGSTFLWNGGFWTGAGTVTIIDAQPNKSVKMRAKFKRPYRSSIDIEFKLQPSSDGTTELDWIVSGALNFRAKAFHLLVNADKMIGKAFEPSLAKIKAIAEGEEKKSAAAATPAAGP